MKGAESAGSPGVVPREEPQAVTFRVLEPDLAIALGVVLDRLADRDAIVDQPTAFSIQVGHLEDQPHPAPRRGEVRLLDPLQPDPPAAGGQQGELVRRSRAAPAQSPRRVDVPADRRLPACDPDHGHEQVDAGRLGRLRRCGIDRIGHAAGLVASARGKSGMAHPILPGPARQRERKPDRGRTGGTGSATRRRMFTPRTETPRRTPSFRGGRGTGRAAAPDSSAAPPRFCSAVGTGRGTPRPGGVAGGAPLNLRSATGGSATAGCRDPIAVAGPAQNSRASRATIGAGEAGSGRAAYRSRGLASFVGGALAGSPYAVAAGGSVGSGASRAASAIGIPGSGPGAGGSGAGPRPHFGVAAGSFRGARAPGPPGRWLRSSRRRAVGRARW